MLVAPKVQIGPQLPADSKREDGSQDGDDHEPVDRSIYVNGIGDSRGYYQDGAYTALPEVVKSDQFEEGEYENDEDYDEELTIHAAYFEALLNQYLHLRTILNSEPPTDALSRLSPDRPVHASAFGRSTSTVPLWSRLLRTTDPHPLQVALMSKETIISIIRILLGGKFLRRGYSLPERTSRWIWALLARLPEKGELNHNEISWVRDLGRRAVLLGRSLAEMAALREELSEGGLGAHEGVDESSSDEEILAETEDLEVEGENGTQDEDEAGSTSSGMPKTKDQHQEPTTSADETTTAAAKGQEPTPTEDREDGEASSDGDVAMDIASDSEAEDGEVTEEPAENLQDAKARLLAQLDRNSPDSDDLRAEAEAARERSRMNMRATLNMILTVAGEFYGQRDLLEFREPFVGM